MKATPCAICGAPVTTRRNVTCGKRCGALLRCRRQAQQRAENPSPSPAPCDVDGCDSPSKSKGLCGKHYQRLRIHGTTENPRPAMPAERRRALGRWRSMIRRCTNPTAASYPRYGARGIKVCERWMNFDAYYDDVGDPPSPGMSLDRIDNDGDYEPGNVRWATAKEQSANRAAKPRPTRCPRGHRYSKANTYTYPDGRRACCICYPSRTPNPDGYLARDPEVCQVADDDMPLWEESK